MSVSRRNFVNFLTDRHRPPLRQLGDVARYTACPSSVSQKTRLLAKNGRADRADAEDNKKSVAAIRTNPTDAATPTATPTFEASS